ncbi:hypothetical protein GCM10009836_65480 [Pseudonocardia ailaonensis]|uniref:Haem-binding uptake Tiki superfamily ChaN domain-containing protein n=2 Tax=Pseudonocardia ailaonensis TaxID=367279 RepID=A0ABN2NM76_9PSEU
MNLRVDDDAKAVIDESISRSGLLLLGEVHGVKETPQVVAAIVQLFGIEILALEWPEQLTETIDLFRRTGHLHDHDLLWLGDGRLTPGHLALLKQLADRNPAVDWLAFDPWNPPDLPGESSWTARDHGMARRILGSVDPSRRSLVVAGNAHTPLTRMAYGAPMGQWLEKERPGLSSVKAHYGPGAAFNFERKELGSRHLPPGYGIRLDNDVLVLDHPDPTEADVPYKPDLFAVDESLGRP